MGVLQTPALDHLATSPRKAVSSGPGGPGGRLDGAEGEARTRTPLRAQRPQRCLSTNSNTSARPAAVLLTRLAGAEGLEPPTCGFGDRRSSQLSYTPTLVILPQFPTKINWYPNTASSHFALRRNNSFPLCRSCLSPIQNPRHKFISYSNIRQTAGVANQTNRCFVTFDHQFMCLVDRNCG